MLDLTTLFAKRGKDEPSRPHGLCQGDPAYIAGREDFLFSGEYNPPSFIRTPTEANAYHCGWSHERHDLAEVCSALHR